MSKHLIDGMVSGCFVNCSKDTIHDVDVGVLSRVLKHTRLEVDFSMLGNMVKSPNRWDGFGVLSTKLKTHHIPSMMWISGFLAECSKHTINEVDFGVLDNMVKTHIHTINEVDFGVLSKLLKTHHK